MNYDVTNLHHFSLIEFYLRLINRRAGIFRFKPLFSNTDSSFTNNEKKKIFGENNSTGNIYFSSGRKWGNGISTNGMLWWIILIQFMLLFMKRSHLDTLSLNILRVICIIYIFIYRYADNMYMLRTCIWWPKFQSICMHAYHVRLYSACDKSNKHTLNMRVYYLLKSNF